MGDVIVIAVLACLVILAVRSMANDRRKGRGCGYGCAGCTRNCARRNAGMKTQSGGAE
ncbi:MAG: FeoB-associated Cys-rich membrane protein [Solobacterium sp.]|nr:FeoB-associated Cys-rich membrane protein [Solobacterium sp.]